VYGQGRRTKGGYGFWHGFRDRACILRFFQSFIVEAGTKTEAGVSLGPESARLGSRRGDSHF
jgi:hypothetical protein